jgi:homocysteine S-methyltransferase
MKNILETLQHTILICDGATGTMLFSKGIDPAQCYEYLSISQPEIIAGLHKEYIDAGADIIETNTFAANISQLAKFKLENEVNSINESAARIARKAAGKAAYVAGSIGPLDKFWLQEYLSDQQIYDIYAQQAVALAKGGVDILMLETFSSLEHIKIALDACKKETSLPVIAQMALVNGLRTSFGNSIHTIIKNLEDGQADCIGANCGSGPAAMRQAILALSEITKKYIISQPNAGYPQNVNGRSMYLTSPEYFAQYAAEIFLAGANIIGGCCGTTPEHIRLIARKLKGQKPAARTIKEYQQEVSFTQQKPFYAEATATKPGIIVELLPPKQADTEKLINTAAMLKSSGASTLSFPENPLAQVRMSAIAAAAIVKEKTGLETIFHYTCRDRNLICLQSDLLGAYALGIKCVLAVTGDPASLGNNPQASSVFDVDSIKLVKLIDNMKKSLRLDMRIGVAFNPNFDDISGQLQRLKRKIEAGAEFVMTQPVFDPEKIKHLGQAVKDFNIPVYLGILPLVSRKNAEYLHNEVPGIKIPGNIRKRMAIDDKIAAQQEGIAIALELIQAARGWAKGFYLISPMHKYEISASIIKQIK